MIFFFYKYKLNACLVISEKRYIPQKKKKKIYRFLRDYQRISLFDTLFIKNMHDAILSPNST